MKNEPAFPFTYEDGGGSYTLHPGMTLRDWFAGQAPEEEIDGMIGNTINQVADFLGIVADEYTTKHYCLAIAKARYIWADAMLAEREKNHE